jgi:rubrerythrin
MSVAEQDLESGGIDRRNFLRLGGMGVVAAAAFAACGSDDNGEVGAGADEGDAPETPEETKGSTSDIRFLNDATASERAAITAYDKMAEKLGDEDDDLGNTLKTLSGHHEEHFGVLAGATEALGGDTNREEDADISGLVERELATATGADGVRRVAYQMELALAQFYAKAVPGLDDKALNKTVLAILGADARHVAALGFVANDPGTPPLSASGLGLPAPGAPAPVATPAEPEEA